MKQLTLPEIIFAAGPIPHSWLLPRCAGNVHHGGFGTTAAGLHAGLPHLVILSIADQFYWGQRVQQLGGGLPPIPRLRLNKENLVAALKELSGKSALREAASALSEQIRAENGVRAAVHLIEETFG